jgi:hypothetical protein
VKRISESKVILFKSYFTTKVAVEARFSKFWDKKETRPFYEQMADIDRQCDVTSPCSDTRNQGRLLVLQEKINLPRKSNGSSINLRGLSKEMYFFSRLHSLPTKKEVVQHVIVYVNRSFLSELMCFC